MSYCCEPPNIEYHNHMMEHRPKSNNYINFVVKKKKKSNKKPIRQTFKFYFQLRKFPYESFLAEFDIRYDSKNFSFLDSGNSILS